MHCLHLMLQFSVLTIGLCTYFFSSWYYSSPFSPAISRSILLSLTLRSYLVGLRYLKGWFKLYSLCICEFVLKLFYLDLTLYYQSSLCVCCLHQEIASLHISRSDCQHVIDIVKEHHVVIRCQNTVLIYM